MIDLPFDAHWILVAAVTINLLGATFNFVACVRLYLKRKQIQRALENYETQYRALVDEANAELRFERQRLRRMMAEYGPVPDDDDHRSVH